MRILILILILLSAGCCSTPKPKGMTDEEALLLANIITLQTQLNIQNMQKSHDSMMKWEDKQFELKLEQLKLENERKDDEYRRKGN